MRRPRRARLLAALVAASCAALWALAVSLPHLRGQAGFSDPLEAALVNLRFSTFGAIEPSGDVVIVAIDDATLAQFNPLGQGRGNLADIIDRIAGAGAAVIAVDILLADAGSRSGDRALARALAAAPAVIAAAGSFAADTQHRGIPATRNELWPQPDFAAVSATGFVNVATDGTGTPRHVPIMFMTSRGIVPSLAAQTAAMLTGAMLDISGDRLRLGERLVPLDVGFQMPLRLAGPIGTVPTVPALDLVEGMPTPDLAGKAVILGVTATGLGDRFPTPFAPDMPGVEVMATAVDQMIGGPGLRRDDRLRRIDLVAAVALSVFCAVLALLRPLSTGLPLAAGALALWLAAVWLAFPFGLWLSAALPLIGAGPPLAAASVLRYAHEKRRAALSRRAVTELKKFQSPALAERIAADPDYLLKPETRSLVVSFVDLTGFTQMSQDLGPERTEAFLKRFHNRLARIVQERDGIILNFMGDGALLVFGVPDLSPHPSDDAMRAAVDMVRETRALGAEEGFAQPLGCRIGLHHGPVVLSRMGGDRHQQLTVTGDSVNLCSRLLEVAKAQSADIVATGAFFASLGQPPPLAPISTGTFPLRGRHGEVDLHFWRV